MFPLDVVWIFHALVLVVTVILANRVYCLEQSKFILVMSQISLRSGYIGVSAFLFSLPSIFLSWIYFFSVPAKHGPDAFAEDSGLSMPLIIAIPGGILLILIIIIICFVRKRSSAQKPATNRPPRSTPQVPVNEKQHTYAAVPGYNNMQNTLSREQILNHSNHSNPSDMNSDASQKMLPMYMAPQMSPVIHNYQAPPQMHPQMYHQPHQHMHHHTYGQC